MKFENMMRIWEGLKGHNLANTSGVLADNRCAEFAVDSIISVAEAGKKTPIEPREANKPDSGTRIMVQFREQSSVLIEVSGNNEERELAKLTLPLRGTVQVPAAPVADHQDRVMWPVKEKTASHSPVSRQEYGLKGKSEPPSNYHSSHPKTMADYDERFGAIRAPLRTGVYNALNDPKQAAEMAKALGLHKTSTAEK